MIISFVISRMTMDLCVQSLYTSLFIWYISSALTAQPFGNGMLIVYNSCHSLYFLHLLKIWSNERKYEPGSEFLWFQILSNGVILQHTALLSWQNILHIAYFRISILFHIFHGVKCHGKYKRLKTATELLIWRGLFNPFWYIWLQLIKKLLVLDTCEEYFLFCP